MALLDEYLVGVDGPWTDCEAAHLYRRAGFGARPDERTAAVGAGDQAAFRAAVDNLVDVFPEDPHLDQAAGSSAGTYGDPFSDFPNDLTDLGQLKDPLTEEALIGRWLYRMQYTSQPLQEQFPLFLHDHMVTEITKIYNTVPDIVNLGNDGSNILQYCSTGTLGPDLLRKLRMVRDIAQGQIDLFRSQGFDSFHDLLVAITRDPAMLIYLDNFLNFAGAAQENFAREVMELFSMGVGNYSEQDIKEIAKCLTGESFPDFLECESNFSFESGFWPAIHEPGDKFVFGQTISEDFTGQETLDVIDGIMSKVAVNPNVSGLPAPYNDLPATSVYTAWKLLTWFVSHDIQLLPTPDPVVLELAHYLRGTDDAPYPQRRYPFDIRAALGKLFTSRFFYDDAYHHAMFKNPAEFIVSALRAVDTHETYSAINGGPSDYLQVLGMRLYSPPNVAGWNHGSAWLATGAIIHRFNYAFRLAHFLLGGPEGDAYCDNLLQTNGGPLVDEFDHVGIVEHFRARLLQQELSTDEHDLLIGFLDNMPYGGIGQYRLKIRGTIQMMMTMPKFFTK
jgi:hypothetical protein